MFGTSRLLPRPRPTAGAFHHKIDWAANRRSTILEERVSQTARMRELRDSQKLVHLFYDPSHTTSLAAHRRSDLALARVTLRDEQACPASWAKAIGIILELTMDEEQLAEETLEDFLLALTRGSPAKSLAVCSLYGRTGRHYPGIETASRETEEWRAYLVEHGFLKPSHSAA